MFGRKSSRSRSMFSPEARRTLSDARDEAGRMRYQYVGPEHLLLALLRKRDDMPSTLLRQSGVEPESVIEAIERRCRPGTAPAPTGDLPYSSRIKQVFELAAAEALARGDGPIAPVHLFMGVLLIAQRGGVLADLGIDLARVRDAYGRVANARRGTGATAPARFDIRIDDASARSIYEQLVAQVQEAVATGALRAGERLPAVRQLADQLDIAPGTVARAYGELERLGVVVTEGARGTRVAPREKGPEANSRPDTLVGLLRPVAVAAFHLGATADEMRSALERAMEGIFGRSDAA